MAVSNASLLSHGATISRVLSARSAPEFAKSAIMAGLVASEDLPGNVGTKTKGFVRESGTAIMSASATLAEATAQALQAPRQDAVVDITAAKAVRVDGISAENQKFGVIGLNSYVQSQARSIARVVDDQILAQFTSITNQVDAAGALTVDDLDDAQLLVLEGEIANADQPLVFVSTRKAMRNLKGELRNSAASAINSERFLSIFDGPPRANGYYGSLPGYELYCTSGFTEVSTQSSQALFHPSWAFCGMFDTSINVMTTEKGSEGVYTEILSYYFWAVGIWNDAAACEVLSLT